MEEHKLVLGGLLTTDLVVVVGFTAGTLDGTVVVASFAAADKAA